MTTMDAEKITKDTLRVSDAYNKLSRAVLDLQEKFSLTYPEVMYILSTQAQTWSKFAAEQERKNR